MDIKIKEISLSYDSENKLKGTIVINVSENRKEVAVDTNQSLQIEKLSNDLQKDIAGLVSSIQYKLSQ